ncbi:VWA domain-containing protein [Caldovatus aquaticus]|uniref:VWA domain-containing protein n=1 Tax=Caldovatus aquaticus TaxID=2865671 RepID=A0ABS7F2J7_9PROT|nr:VWA domain-containing protein [Caldovatus aquaticus]MBW8269046.1 VWA domain-containing protein [Caldovatus aquaticus]
MTAPLAAPVLRDFLRAARSAGLRVSTAEGLDAIRAAEAVGLADRATLRDALSLVLAKTAEEKRRFEECFALFFGREGFREVPAPPRPAAEGAPEPAAPEGPGAAGGIGGGDMGGGATPSPLGRMLLAGDRAGLAAAMEQAAEAIGLSNISVFTQVNMYARRIMERMGLEELEDEIAALRRDPAGAERAARLELARDYLRGEVRELVQRNLLLFARGETERWREEMLRQARLAGLDRRDAERMRVLVRAIARRLATRYARVRRRDRRGQLDARRTLRRNMAWGGVPFRTVWKQRKVEKPRLFVLCDVSGSVAAVAEFLLLFVYSLHEALSGVRAFAFTSGTIEVSEILEREPIEQAIAQIMGRIGFGSSNYGTSLEDFEKGWMQAVDRRTTVIVLGDGRGNRTEPRVDILQRLAGRAKQVIWLNPEHPASWGSGDSDMLRYAPHCRLVAHCATLAQLERVIGDLLRDHAG